MKVTTKITIKLNDTVEVDLTKEEAEHLYSKLGATLNKISLPMYIEEIRNKPGPVDMSKCPGFPPPYPGWPGTYIGDPIPGTPIIT
jgi:hypothetical protein